MLLFRGLSYALMGGFLGYGGQRLKESLEIRAVGGLSLVVFSVISLLCILPLLFPPLRKFSPLSALSRFRGLIWGLMPCHLLLFYYGISVLTASAWTGAGVLMIHAVMTTPALLFANRFIQKTELLGPRVAKIVKYTLVFMVILSLTSFWWALLQASPVGKENPWLCF